MSVYKQVEISFPWSGHAARLKNATKCRRNHLLSCTNVPSLLKKFAIRKTRNKGGFRELRTCGKDRMAASRLMSPCVPAVLGFALRERHHSSLFTRQEYILTRMGSFVVVFRTDSSRAVVHLPTGYLFSPLCAITLSASVY